MGACVAARRFHRVRMPTGVNVAVLDPRLQRVVVPDGGKLACGTVEPGTKGISVFGHADLNSTADASPLPRGNTPESARQTAPARIGCSVSAQNPCAEMAKWNTRSRAVPARATPRASPTPRAARRRPDARRSSPRIPCSPRSAGLVSRGYPGGGARTRSNGAAVFKKVRSAAYDADTALTTRLRCVECSECSICFVSTMTRCFGR